MKNSFYILFFAFIILYGFSCPTILEFDGSERYRIKGKITDEKGNPMSNIDVALCGIINFDYLDDNSIQRGKTDQNGNFDLIFSKNNADIYYLKMNYSMNYYNENQISNENYAEKYLSFSPSRFKDYEYDISSHCSLLPGISLNFICDSLKDNYNFCYVNYETSEDIDLDEKVNYDNYRYIQIYEKLSSKIIVPKNSLVKFTIYTNSNSYIDSVFVTDTPYTYKIK